MNLGDSGIQIVKGGSGGGGGTAPLDVVVVSGSGTVSSDGSYTRNGNAGGRAAYANGSNAITWNGSEWEIYDDVLGSVAYYSSDDVSAPWLASTWVESGGDTPAPSVSQATGTLAEALAAKAERDDLLLKADASDLALKANDADVLKLAGTQSASAIMTWSGRQQMTGQPAIASLAANDAVTRDLSVLEWAFTPMISTTAFAAGASGAGASAAVNGTGFTGPGSAFMTSSGTSGSYGRLVVDNLGCRGGSNVPLNRSWYCVVDWGNTALSTNTDFLFLFGSTSTPTAALSARGLQCKLNSTLGNTTVELGIHNGSSLSTATGTITSMSSPTTRHWVFRWDSSTNTFSLYATDAAGSTAFSRAALIGSVTQAPGSTTAAGSAFSMMLYATGTPAGTSGLNLNGVSYLDK